ncbi:putative lipid II flippase FtsW [Bacillus taeanensis]|uniref:Probable peptidoglycan glycosyltransferase FtsW n=1 Tax=Bacillus taeanensis TaxID=273032 RepID=A0A366XSR4_9BACI|nr:putative lipid II flippase FtsW [Bacillus taeanensis]RBW69420.1 putative lipid II flippase FtsW [Bacillus taeanensis]
MIKKMFRHYDYSLIIAILLLSGFGLLMVYSSSIVVSVIELKQSSNFFFLKQLKWLLIALVMFFLTMLFPYKAYKRFMKLVAMLSIIVLLSVKVFGSVANNAQSWLSIGGVSVQPSEFVKLGMIIYLAAIFSKKQTYISDFTKAVLPPLIMIVVVFLLVASQPDLGTALIIAGISGVMIICSGMRMKHLFSLIGLAVLAIGFAAPFFLTAEQSSRFAGAYDPFSDPDGNGYQLVNSYIAIASGGVSGRGLGQSIQKFGFLPEPQTDFIMAIISEELGIFGVLFVLGLLAFIVFKGFLIGMRCKDTFGSLLAIGIAAMLAIQSIVNLGAVTGLLPITGVPLPFISYGGSFLVLSMIAMGILVNISSFVNMKQSYSTNTANTKGKITLT